MSLSRISKGQLFLIATDEATSIEERYQAARILQSLNISNINHSKVIELKRIFTIKELAEIFGAPTQLISGIIGKYETQKG